VPWVVKVVAVVRRPGQTAEGLRAVLAAAEVAFTADCAVALALREAGASFRWNPYIGELGGNVYEVYPKLALTLPNHEDAQRPPDPAPIYEKLAACRDAIVARLEALAAAQGWTLLRMHTKRYGD